MRNRRIAIAFAVAGTMLLAACSSSGGGTTASTSGAATPAAPGSTSATSAGGSVSAPAPADSAATSAGPTPASLHAMLPADVQKSGVLKVATDASYPPFEFYGKDNKTIEGADPDFAQALSALLGVKFELHNTGFDGIPAGLAAGKWDLAMSGMADTRERQKQISFVDYANNGDAFLVKKGNEKTYPSWDSLCGKTVANQTGTDTVADLESQTKKCTQEGKPAIKVSDYGTQDQGVLAVTSGRAGLLLSSGGSAAYIAAQSHGQLSEVVPPDNPPGSFGALGIALGKNRPQLAKAVEAAVTELMKNGTYATIMKKWGLTQCCTISASAINGGT